MNRRDFLQANKLAQTAGHFLGAVEELTHLEPESTSREFALLRAARRAMATQFEVVLPYSTPDALRLAEVAFAEIDRLEEQLTVYRDTSEVSRLNQLGALSHVPLEEGLFELLTVSARVASETEGAFDVTSGPLIKVWGFYRGPRRVPSEAERAAALACVGMRHLELRPENRSAHFLKAGMEINLGSIGKGYALDRTAALLRKRWSVSSALLHGGHSSVYAIGTEPGEGSGWAVGIQHPWDDSRRLALVRLRDRALGTSAATFQHLEYKGRKLGHILDPRTGWPAEGMASATVIAPTAAQADALATAFFILGAEKTRAYCETHTDVGAVLLTQEHPDTPVVLGNPQIEIL
jgi:thiamine biosynthesis lipoprotein